MNQVTVSFVDVGQGDCTTVVDENGIGILIDCPSRGDEAAVFELDAKGCKSLRAAIVTHSDEDHAGGLLDAVERLAERFDGMLFFNCDSLAAAPVAGPDRGVAGKRRRAFLMRAREYKSRVAVAQAGGVQKLGMMHWQFVAPIYGEVIEALAVGNPNVASAIVIISAFGKNIVVSGDAQLATWERVANSLPPQASVRWPHHGGLLNTGDQLSAQRKLFDICKPARVIVSVGGNNSLGHPTEAFFVARQACGAELICTEASKKCVRGGGQGGVCAGTIRMTLTANEETISTETPDHAARIAEFGAGQCVIGTHGRHNTSLDISPT